MRADMRFVLLRNGLDNPTLAAMSDAIKVRVSDSSTPAMKCLALTSLITLALQWIGLWSDSGMHMLGPACCSDVGRSSTPTSRPTGTWRSLELKGEPPKPLGRDSFGSLLRWVCYSVSQLLILLFRPVANTVTRKEFTICPQP